MVRFFAVQHHHRRRTFCRRGRRSRSVCCSTTTTLLALCISSSSTISSSSAAFTSSTSSSSISSLHFLRVVTTAHSRQQLLQLPPTSNRRLLHGGGGGIAGSCSGCIIRKMWTTTTALASSTLSSSSSEPSNNEKKNKSSSMLRVALCQFTVTDNVQINHEVCRDYLQQAAYAGAQLVVLPEIWASPYATTAFPDYAQVLPNVNVNVDNDNNSDNSDNNEPLTSSSAELLRQAAIEYNYWIIGGSLAEKSIQDDKLYNTCLVFNPQGKVVTKHRKIHLFDINVPNGIYFHESDTLSPGNTPTFFDLKIIPKSNNNNNDNDNNDNDNASSGTITVRIGIGICYDIRFAAYSMLLRHQYNCQVLCFPGAFNMTTGPAHWELLQRARAIDNQCFVLTASPARSGIVDNNKEMKSSSSKYPPYTAWGHSTAVSPWGTVLATTDEKPSLVMVDLDLNTIPVIRKSIPISEQERKDIYQIIAVPGNT